MQVDHERKQLPNENPFTKFHTHRVSHNILLRISCAHSLSHEGVDKISQSVDYTEVICANAAKRYYINFNSFALTMTTKGSHDTR